MQIGEFFRFRDQSAILSLAAGKGLRWRCSSHKQQLVVVGIVILLCRCLPYLVSGIRPCLISRPSTSKTMTSSISNSSVYDSPKYDRSIFWDYVMSKKSSANLALSARTDPPSKPHLSVNNTPLRRFLILATLRLCRRILPRHGPVLMLSKKLCIKVGTLKQPAEAATMQFIAEHTSIPVPKVYCAFERNGCKYILMERIQGDILRNGWLERNEASKDKILAQLKGIVDEMRLILLPGGQGISSLAGGPLFDGRLPGGSFHGPFETTREFHKYLREGYEGGKEDALDANKLVDFHNQYSRPLVFTHGDLSTMNIMARGDDIVGIIDWETAGWWPDYWEYTSAWHVNPYNEFWREEVDKFLEPWPEELQMEKVRRRCFGDF